MARHPLREILIIGLSIFVFLGLHASLGYEVKISASLKKADVLAYFTPSPRPVLSPTLPQKDSTRLATEKKTDSLRQVKPSASVRPSHTLDTTAQTILLTGDSMCEQMMFRWMEYAQKNRHKLITRIWYGSTTEKWSESDSLKKLIAIYRPSYIFFTTGSNELFIRDIQAREPHIQDIVQQAGAYPFIWIGPPNWTKDTGINTLIEKNVGKDRFFESQYLKFDRLPDGAHPTRRSAAIWADTIAQWVMHKSRHKIRLLKP